MTQDDEYYVSTYTNLNENNIERENSALRQIYINDKLIKVGSEIEKDRIRQEIKNTQVNVNNF
ncbi:MAG: hypothetical protein ACFFB0_01490 [Promethearchaeota archaeon]